MKYGTGTSTGTVLTKVANSNNRICSIHEPSLVVTLLDAGDVVLVWLPVAAHERCAPQVPEQKERVLTHLETKNHVHRLGNILSVILIRIRFRWVSSIRIQDRDEICGCKPPSLTYALIINAEVNIKFEVLLLYQVPVTEL